VFGVFAPRSQHVEGDALRRFLSDARQAFEFGDQPLAGDAGSSASLEHPRRQ
jgi:hypothetical protein